MSIPGAATARDLARELLERETASATDAARLADAMQRVCIHISEKLRRSVGDDGYVALLEHVVAAMEHDHRVVLKDIWRADAAGIHLHVASAVESRGAATVNAALESLLAALVGMLNELIGADLTRMVLEHDGSPRSRTRQERR
jgi:hypothetical protein